MIYRIYYQGVVKYITPVKNREELMALRNSKENLEHLAKARGGDPMEKGKLLQLAYNLGHAEGKLAGVESIGSYFFHDVDCYDPAQSAEIKALVLSKKDEIGLMMLEKSPGGGWHLVCRREPGTTILENQVKVATALHIEMDTNAKNLNRVVFSTSGSEEDLPYLDDALFDEPMTAEACALEYQRLKDREKKGQEQVPQGARKANKHYRPWEDGASSDPSKGRGGLISQKSSNPNPELGSTTLSRSPNVSPNAAGIHEADERTRFIFRECMKEEGVTETDLTDEGGRHNSVKMVLSSCNQLLSKAETLSMLKELMPDHWQDENIQTLVNDFYTDYYNPSQRLTLFQKRVFRESRKIGQRADDAEEMNGQRLSENSLSQNELSRIFASKTPPEIPAQLPRLVKTVLQNTPQKFKAAVAQAMFPPLATYPQKLSFVYIDNQVRDLRINCLIVAPTGSGKDSCTKQPLTHLIADMQARDHENRLRLMKYNDECNAKASNKQKPQRPEGLIIQNIKADITKAALVQRMVEADSAPLYVRLNELEQWDQIEAKSGRSNHFTTMKLCDDEGNDYGSDRASTQSVMGDGCLHLNWNANTTTSKAIRYFRYVLTDGPISRLCLATIVVDDDDYDDDIAVFGKYDQSYDEALKPFIDNLKAATGEIDCLEAKRMARRLLRECAEFYRLSQDKVFDNLTHRALVAAFRKGCLLYAANGMKWERSIDTFCRWSLFYDLYLKMTIWGDQIRHADDDIPTSKRGPQSLLDFLPETFTLEDAKRVRQQQGKSNEGRQCQNMISQWLFRKYVLQITDYSYKKATINNKNNGSSGNQ